MNGEIKPMVRNNLTISKVDEKLLVLNEETNQVHQLNATAALIFGYCDGSTTVTEIELRIGTQFEVDSNIVSHDVKQTLDNFRANQLLAD